MIERIYTKEDLLDLPEHGVEAQKIRALWLAYGSQWDFCRFFRQGSAYLAALDGSFVICDENGCDTDELSGFLLAGGFSDIICSVDSGLKIGRSLGIEPKIVNLMTYAGAYHSSKLPTEVQPGEIWNVIEKRFSPAFEPWYLDMSHRVRHGVTKCFSDGKAALVLQHDINNEALISQVCVLPDDEGKGYASGLLRKVCQDLSSTVQVVCEDELRGFYEKCDFIKTAELCILA